MSRAQLIFVLCAMVAILAGMPANAAFIGPYAPGNFSLVNTNANGMATLQQDGSLLVIGPQNGSGDSGTTDFLIAAVETGVVSFNFFYVSQDFPGFDYAGYILANSFTQLADTVGTSGLVTFNVMNGQTFGFRVGSADNTGEPGQLTISNFTAPLSNGTATPEPGTWALTAAVLLAIMFAPRPKTAAARGRITY